MPRLLHSSLNTTLFLCALTVLSPAAGAAVPGDVDGDGKVNAVDVQLVINAALGIELDGGYATDINGDAAVNALDIQLVINAALGIDISDLVWAPNTFTFDVEYAPDAVLVDEADLGVLVDFDLENEVYTLDAARVQELGLDLSIGNVLILHGLAMRRIASVEEDGANLVVGTDFVPLNEVIPNGIIEWDYGVLFTPDVIKSIEIPGAGVTYPKDATPISFTVTIGDFKYIVKASLDTNLVTFDFTVEKELPGPAGAKFTAVGELKRFRSKNKIEFADGQLQEFGHGLNGIRGDVKLELVLAASGNNVVDLKFPTTLMKIPFLVGPIPVELNIKIQFVLSLSVPFDGSSRVSTHFTYDSDLGFTFDGIELTAGGRMGPIEFGDEVHQTGASSAIAANFGIGFPRVELSILRNSVVPWAQTAFLVGGSFTFHPACQTADAMFLGAAGYNLGLFGIIEFASGSKTFFREDKELLRDGDCPKAHPDFYSADWRLAPHHYDRR